jgi:hypothetical protein
MAQIKFGFETGVLPQRRKEREEEGRKDFTAKNAVEFKNLASRKFSGES